MLTKEEFIKWYINENQENFDKARTQMLNAERNLKKSDSEMLDEYRSALDEKRNELREKSCNLYEEIIHVEGCQDIEKLREKLFTVLHNMDKKLSDDIEKITNQLAALESDDVC